MTESERASESLGDERPVLEAGDELPRSVAVPEPGRSRVVTRRTGGVDAYEGRGIAGAVWSWVGRHRLEAGVFLATVAALTGLAIYTSIDPGPGRAAPIVTVGPPSGQNISVYVETRRRALEDVAGGRGTRVAVVTFKSALTGQQLAELSLPPGVDLEEAVVGDGLGFPEAVGAENAAMEVEHWRQRRLEILETQRSGLTSILAASPSPSPAQEWFAKEAASVDKALVALRQGNVVLGAVVSGTENGLVQLQENPAVLLVDLAPPGVRPEQVSFRLALSD